VRRKGKQLLGRQLTSFGLKSRNSVYFANVDEYIIFSSFSILLHADMKRRSGL